MPQKTQRQLIEEIHNTTTELSTVLLGVRDTANGGLVQEVKDFKLDLKELGKSHGKLKKNFWLLVGGLVGSGVIGSSIWSLLSG